MAAVGAVVTTGIYCRPACAARPDPTNVREYPSAAAAEADGYRACRRCRPYRTEHPAGWIGPDLVCRAVQLIGDGFLDDRSEMELGARLAVSPRHLRRLFAEHLGVTPDGLARSRRAHFARRLLDDTDLSITDIAFASGFGSLRQLNRTMLDVFQEPPSHLRRRRRRSDRLVADGGLRLRLSHSDSYDWPAVLHVLRASAIPGVERVDGDTYRRTATIGGDPAVVEVASAGQDHLLVTMHLPQLRGLIHQVERVRHLVGLDHDEDHEARAAALSTDSTIGPLVAKRPGARVPGAWDPFEVGVRATIGAHVGSEGAGVVTGRLVARHGRPVGGLAEVGLTHVFPTSTVLADPRTTFDGLGLPTHVVHAVRALAAAVEVDVLRTDRSQPLDDALHAAAAAGVERQVAQQIAWRLGEPDVFPSGDQTVERAAARLVGDEVSDQPLDVLSRRWSPNRSLAALHLGPTPG